MSTKLAAITVLVCALFALAASGCAGGGGASTTSTAAEANPGKQSDGIGSAEPGSGPPAAAFHPQPHHDSGGGSAQFEVKGGDNSVQEFGAEADEAELQAAASALHGFLDARAGRNWRAACSYLSGDVKRGFTQVATSGQAKSQVCAATLAALSSKVPTSTLAEAAQADVGALRFEGDSAFLIYHGVQETVFAISMAKEGGAWKVASLSGVPLS